jgi:hypothetical protein
VGLADQWTADRLIVLRKDKTLTILWLIGFGDDANAEKFATVYKRILGGIPVAHPFRLATKSNEVLIAIGAGSDAFDQFAPAVWGSSVIAPKPSSSATLMVPSAAAVAGSP